MCSIFSTSIGTASIGSNASRLPMWLRLIKATGCSYGKSKLESMSIVCVSLAMMIQSKKS